MFIIQPRITGDWSSNESLNDLIDAVDIKVMSLACCKSSHIQYDLACETDMDLYSDLMAYRRILLDKLLGCHCLTDQKLIKIVSRIKILTR